jgi:hypothetical protein
MFLYACDERRAGVGNGGQGSNSEKNISWTSCWKLDRVVVEKWIFKIFELYCEHKNL